jgi:hypothetical protein
MRYLTTLCDGLMAELVNAFVFGLLAACRSFPNPQVASEAPHQAWSVFSPCGQVTPTAP